MYSKTPNIFSFASHYRYELLSPKDLEELKGKTLYLLEEVGVHFPSNKALKIFADNGANVDMDKQVVRIPPDLVKKAMATAPRTIVLGGRKERLDLNLDGTSSYVSTAGTAPNFIDLETRQKRPSQKEDLSFIARICDALPMVSLVWSVVTSQDYGVTAPVHDCHALLTSTLKHVRGARGMFPQLAPYIIEMASVVAGGEEEIRQHPPISATITSLTPLAYDKFSIECALIYAKAGLPVMFMAKPILCSTAPASILGAISVGDAEVISGMVLTQLAYPGAPVMHILWVDQMHPITGECLYHNPLPWNVIAIQLGHSWNVPCGGGAIMETSASGAGWRSGAASGFGAATIPICGSELCGFIGLLSGMIFTPEQLFLDHECLLNAHSFYNGFDFNVSDIPLDLIKKVGHGGHYLSEEHTIQHIRDFRFSPLMREKNEDDSYINSQEIAWAEINKINQEHNPEPLSEETLSELRKIVAAADREAENIL